MNIYKGEPLLYEEFVMLQDILLMVSNTDFYDSLDPIEREIFDDLYDKIMQS